MRILFFVPYPPNLIRVRPYNLTRQLRNLGHDVTIATLWSSDEERDDIEALRADGFTVIDAHLPRRKSLFNLVPATLSGKPLQSAYSWSSPLAQRMAGAVNNTNGGAPYDVIHVEHLRGSRYGLYMQHSADVPVVWDSVDCISLLFEQAQAQSRSRFGRLMTRFELKRTTEYERWLTSQFDPILVTSRIDREALLELVPKNSKPPSITAFHGVDLDYFRPNPNVKRDPATVVVTGKMSYHANITMVMHLANDIMPLVWAQRPDAQLVVVGKAPSAEILALAQQPSITVTGEVDDIRPFLQRATVAATPIAYGAGIQNKLLEAMACETPVVSTPKGCAALNVVPERDLLVADDAQTFATALLDLIGDPDRQRQIGQAGCSYVNENYSWARNSVQLQQVYHETIRQYRQ